MINKEKYSTQGLFVSIQTPYIAVSKVNTKKIDKIDQFIDNIIYDMKPKACPYVYTKKMTECLKCIKTALDTKYRLYFVFKLLVYCRFHSVQAISQLAKFNGGEIL